MAWVAGSCRLKGSTALLLGLVLVQSPRQIWRGLFYWSTDMWKIVVGFIVFAGLAVYLLNTAGDIDLSGEKHGAVCPPATAFLKV